jgi:hypothetical protein
MTPHITLDPNGTGALYCQHCAELYPPSLPCTVERWIDQCRGFVLMHKHCPKPLEPSKQVQLFDELAKREPVLKGRASDMLRELREDDSDGMETEDECSARTVREEMRAACSHKFVDSKNCLKCRISFAELKAESLRESRRLNGIDGNSDAPDPETDPPGNPLQGIRASDWLRELAEDDAEGEVTADGAPLPPPAYSHLVPDEATRLKFLQHYPWPKDSFQLRADLAIVLQRIEGAELPSAATVNGWHPDTIQFQKAAGWVRDELADMNRTEHPEFDLFLPLERQPMPKELAALCMPPKRKAKGARPLANPKPRARKSA